MLLGMCWELQSGMHNGGQTKEKAWKFSRATLGFLSSKLREVMGDV